MPTRDNISSPMTLTTHGGVTVDVLKIVQNTLFLPNATAADGVAVSCEWRNTDVQAAGKTTGEAWIAGQDLYWDPATSKFTTTAGSLVKRAKATADAASAATTGRVVLLGT